MTEIRPIQTDGKTSLPSVPSESAQTSILDSSIFGDIDTDGDGFISADEAKKYGFCAWEIKENMSKADFEAKAKTYNDTRTAEAQTQQTQSEPQKSSRKFSANELKKMMYESCALRFESDEKYNEEFDKLWLKYNGNADKVAEEIYKLSQTMPHNILLDRANVDRLMYINLEYNDFVFDDIDMTQYPLALRHITFNENTFSKVSKEHLPEGFTPKEIMEKGKTIGLGIDKVHQAGFTGKGVSYAIIDSGTLDASGLQHNDIQFKEYSAPQNANAEGLNHYHGRAVSYIAQEIAPDADCYYYAATLGSSEQTVDSLKGILEKNKTLPDNNKIRFVSMSMPLYGGEEAKKVVAELEKQGVWVYYSGNKIDAEQIGYLGKIDPNGNPDDFNNYRIENPREGNPLYINSGDRTVPSSASPTAYRHDSDASKSWAIPVIAGYYTLACQADPAMTKERFLELAHQTAHKIQSDAPNEFLKTGGTGRTEEKQEIKVIDINALLEKIQSEKQP